MDAATSWMRVHVFVFASMSDCAAGQHLHKLSRQENKHNTRDDTAASKPAVSAVSVADLDFQTL